MKLEVHFRKPIIMAVVSLILCIRLPGLSGMSLQFVRCAIVSLNMLVVLSTYRRGRGVQNLEIWLYGAVITLSSYLNNPVSNELLSGTLYALMIISSYIVFFSAMQNYGDSLVFRDIRNVVVAVAIIVGSHIVITQGAGVGSNDEFHKSFLIGSKFAVSYFNMFALSLILGKLKRFKVIIPVALSAVLIYVDLLADCMTGIVGMLVLIILYYCKDKIVGLLMKPRTAVCAIILSGAFAMFIEIITNMNIVKWFVMSVLNSDLDMTGRVGIFAVLADVVKSKPMFGYGYANTAIVDILGYGNPQNGIFDITVSYGIIGALTFLNVVRCAFASHKYNHYQELSDEKYMLLAFIYSMILCGTVEINYSILFLIAVSMYKSKNDDIIIYTERGDVI